MVVPAITGRPNPGTRATRSVVELINFESIDPPPQNGLIYLDLLDLYRYIEIYRDNIESKSSKPRFFKAFWDAPPFLQKGVNQVVSAGSRFGRLD